MLRASGNIARKLELQFAVSNSRMKIKEKMLMEYFNEETPRDSTENSEYLNKF